MSGSKRRIARISTLFFAVFLILFVIPNSSILFASDRVELEIIRVDAPEFCKYQNSFKVGFLKKSQRSTSPEAGHGGYCGYIETSRGVYLLPETHDRRYLSESRSKILAQLSPGCTYSVVISGFGEVYAKPGQQYAPFKHIVSKVDKKISCD